MKNLREKVPSFSKFIVSLYTEKMTTGTIFPYANPGKISGKIPAIPPWVPGGNGRIPPSPPGMKICSHPGSHIKCGIPALNAGFLHPTWDLMWDFSIPLGSLGWTYALHPGSK